MIKAKSLGQFHAAAGGRGASERGARERLRQLGRVSLVERRLWPGTGAKPFMGPMGSPLSDSPSGGANVARSSSASASSFATFSCVRASAFHFVA